MYSVQHKSRKKNSSSKAVKGYIEGIYRPTITLHNSFKKKKKKTKTKSLLKNGIFK